MNCIKEKCGYYVEDGFRQSYFRCLIDEGNAGMKKEADHRCIINEIIEIRKYQLSLLENIKNTIINEQ